MLDGQEVPESVQAAIEKAKAIIHADVVRALAFSTAHGPGWTDGQYADRAMLVSARINGEGSYRTGATSILAGAYGAKLLQEMRDKRIKHNRESGDLLVDTNSSGDYDRRTADYLDYDRNPIPHQLTGVTVSADREDEDGECRPDDGYHVDGCEDHCYDGDHVRRCDCECDLDEEWHNPRCSIHCFDGQHGDDCECECDPDNNFHSDDCECDDDDEDY